VAALQEAGGTMRAAVYRGDGRLRVERIPVPEVGSGELLVRVDACGICGTDIKKIQRDLLPGPRVFGHETAGTVVRVGGGVKRFREGDRVALHHHVPCGSCSYCREGLYSQCAGYKRNGTTAGFAPAGGGFAEFVRVCDWIVERGVVPVPAGVAAVEASFVEPLNTCLKAVERSRLQPGETALVVGQGPVGSLLMQVARWRGARVFTSDTLADRLALSRSLGADAAFDAHGDVVSEIQAQTGRGVDVAFLAALGQPALDQAVGATRSGGRVLVFAATSPGERAEVDLGSLCASEKEILTSYSASIDLQDRAAQLIFDREVRVRELISHRLDLGEAPRAVELASRPDAGVMKVMLTTERE
jgi:L-iditol 2-dehydrogenase